LDKSAPTAGVADLDRARPLPHAPLLADAALPPSPPPHPPFLALGPPGVADGVEAPAACEPGEVVEDGGTGRRGCETNEAGCADRCAVHAVPIPVAVPCVGLDGPA
jgi:hypothetical protein